MDKLPSELLHNIFIFLPIVQKQECMIVCSKWASIIRTKSLFHTVTLFYNQERFKKFINLIEKHKVLGNQVVYLYLYDSIAKDYDRRRLLHLFPNLKAISATRHTYKANQSFSEESFDLKSFRGQLERIDDSFTCEMTRGLLTSGLCSHLVTLSLTQLSRSATHRNIFQQLKEAPLLRRLELTNADITMEDCNIIHNNLPLLQTLKLFVCNIMQSEVPVTDILPSFTLTTLHMSSLRLEQQHLIDWPQYISIKYPNLEHFDYDLDPFKTSTLSNDMNTLYKEGYSLVLQRLGSQLKSLTFNSVKYDIGIFKKLDVFGCQIKNLELKNIDGTSLYALSESGQSKYVETLDLVKLDVTSPFGWLTRMESLRSLKLSFDKRKELCLSDLLQLLPPTIESVYIDHSYIDTKICTEDTFPIKRLLLKSVSVTSQTGGIDVLVNKCMPDLRRLTIQCLFTENKTLMFPNHHFSMLSIEVSLKPVDFAITTLNDNKTRFFSKKKSKYRTDFSVLHPNLEVPVSEDKLANKILITVVCGSVKNLHLNNSLAYF